MIAFLRLRWGRALPAAHPAEVLSPALTVALGLVLLASAVLPLLVVPFFPSVDLWTHLAVSSVQRQVLSGQGPVSGAYDVLIQVYPYLAGHLVPGVLGSFLPAVTAGAVALALSQVLIVLGGWTLGAVLETTKSTRLLVLALLVTALRGLTPGQALGAAAALGGLFLLHVEAWGPCGLIASVMDLAHPQGAASSCAWPCARCPPCCWRWTGRSSTRPRAGPR